MQPAGPAPLPHTRPRPGHWLATAAVLAAVITGAALFGPEDTTATATVAAPAATRAAAPDAAAVHYPLTCGGGRDVEIVTQAP
ncbi:hypothetical protein AB0K09_32525, partial [Streptomyces sp. NPDC049577]